jgi:hypothetical protein
MEIGVLEAWRTQTRRKNRRDNPEEIPVKIDKLNFENVGTEKEARVAKQPK